MPLQVHRFRFPPAGKKQDSIKSATSDGITGSKTDLKGKSMRGERASSSTKDEKESRVLDRNWVNVKEQLPAEDHIVLVFDPQLLVGVAIAVFDGKNFFSVSGENLTMFLNVTHWMRLPNRPVMT